MRIDLSNCRIADNDDGTKRIERYFEDGYGVIYHRCVIHEDGEIVVVANPLSDELATLIENL